MLVVPSCGVIFLIKLSTKTHQVGTEINTIGQTHIQLDLIPDPVSVIIVDKLSHGMILGESVLRSGCAILDLKDNILQWYVRKWKVQQHGIAGFESIGPITPQTGDANIDLFSSKGERPGVCNLEALMIKTNCNPICQKAYRTPLSKRKLVEDSIAEMLDHDIIEPSSSAWASPITLVPKRDNSTRFCIDYRKLNAETENSHPIPLIRDLLDEMGGTKGSFRVNSTNFDKSSQVSVSNIAQKIPKITLVSIMKACQILGCNSEYFWRYSLSNFLFCFTFLPS